MARPTELIRGSERMTVYGEPKLNAAIAETLRTQPTPTVPQPQPFVNGNGNGQV